ncbi:porin family protein [Dyadobacter luticola]|uniref:PorT family protein n=1 Tax=Dyadobacter luticola TaxID=1979387 RepID=A0A5R9L5N9_9BACT|nr:porin family protein [Dyadobacter luticola]TLV03721.1 PorT family protein [Dyadobacter luticola]
MKKLLFAIALFFSVQTAFAQSFSFGPKAGLNISNYTGGNIESDALVGYHLGGMLNFGLGRVFSIQPEVLFSTQGAKVDRGGTKSDFKINYVTLPIMLKFKSSGGFYFEFGPQVGFRASSNVPDQTIDNFAKNLDLGGGVGIGYQSPIGLGIGARYVAGFSKVGDFTGQNISPDFKNSVIQASIFWLIPIVK